MLETDTSPRPKNVHKAKKQIIELLKVSPRKTGELLEGLGYNTFNFYITKQIGDNAGEWDNSAHQIALTELVEQERIRWWYDEKLNVTYGMPKHRKKHLCGENSPERKRVVECLDSIARMAASSVGLEKVDWRAPFETVREIDANDNSISLHCDGEKIQVVEHDFVTGFSFSDKPEAEFTWPCSDEEKQDAANAVVKFFRKRKNN